MFNDDRAQRIVNYALAYAARTRTEPEDGEIALAARVTPVFIAVDQAAPNFANPPAVPGELQTWQIRIAAVALRDFRAGDEERCAKDSELAAAEHYTFIRWLARESGDPIVLKLPAGYHRRKVTAYERSQLEDMTVIDGAPPHPPDENILRWGKNGASEGLAEFSGGYLAKAGSLGRSIVLNEGSIIKGLDPFLTFLVRSVVCTLRLARCDFRRAPM